MSVTPVNSVSDYWKTIEDNKIVVAFFRATWSGPCRMISPFVDSLAAKHSKKVKFVSVDVDVVSDIAEQHGIKALSAFVLFLHGERVDTVVGANPEHLRRAVDKVIGSLEGSGSSQSSSPIAGRSLTDRTSRSEGPSKTITASVTPVNSYSDYRKTIADNKIVVAFFRATWSGPCRMISPFVDSLAAKHSKKVKFVSVDVDAVSDIAEEHGIKALPAFVLFVHGEKVKTSVIAFREHLRKLVEEAAGRY